MNNFKKIIALACAAIVLVACIYFGYGYYTTNKKLVVAQQEMNVLSVNYNELNTELDKLSTELVETKEELERSNEIIATRDGEVYFVDLEVTEREITMLAQTVYGEARGCGKLQQSAVVWCILNRVDAGRGTIAQVITAPNQFHGYSSSFPVTDEIEAVVRDVVARWKLEKTVCGDVGRTLPNNYLYFAADGTGSGNVFRTSWNGGNRWNWDCWNPYS